MGRIGQRVAARLKPFDVKMYYFDLRHLSTTEEQTLGVRYMSLDALTQQSDVISIHISLTPQTVGLFDRERLFSMKKGAYLVNVGRGKVVDTDALVEALERGHLAGACLDVTDPEPLPSSHPLWSMPNVVITPHMLS